LGMLRGIVLTLPKNDWECRRRENV